MSTNRDSKEERKETPEGRKGYLFIPSQMPGQCWNVMEANTNTCCGNAHSRQIPQQQQKLILATLILEGEQL